MKAEIFGVINVQLVDNVKNFLELMNDGLFLDDALNVIQKPHAFFPPIKKLREFFGEKLYFLAIFKIGRAHV